MSRRIPLVVAAVLSVVIACMMCAFQVRFNEHAVVTRFDEIKSRQPDDPGLHFKFPWPIDRVYRYDKRLRCFETEFRQAATEDQKTVILTAYATWRIDDPQKFLKSVGREDTAASKIRDLLENQVQLVLRTHKFEQLVNIDEEKLKLQEIEKLVLHGAKALGQSEAENMRGGIQAAARDRYGVEIVSVGIKRLGLPETVTKDVFARMKEERQKAIRQYEAEGEAEAQRIRAGAEETKNKIIARAEGYAKTLLGQADAEAAKYYKIFEQHRELSDFLKNIEATEAIFESGSSTVILDVQEVPPLHVLDRTPQAGANSESGKATEDDGDAVTAPEALRPRDRKTADE